MRRRLVNPKRFYTFVAVVVMTIALVFAVALADNSYDIVGYENYVVQSGDTLWSIAKQSNGYDYIHTQDIIIDIKSATNIPTNISVGQLVKIPVYDVER